MGDGTLGGALACTMIGAIPAMWVAGRAGNRPGVPLLSASVVAFGLSSMLPAMASDGLWLAGCLAAVGAASGTLDVLMNACVSEMEAVDGRLRMHLAHAMYSAGVFGASIVAGLLRQIGLGYRPILLLAALTIMALAAATRLAPGPGLADCA